jgi:hypothetical protein
MEIKKAERKQVKLRIALIGSSGSGKTYSALRLTKGMGGKTCLIDTEFHRSEYYADKFDFDVLHLTKPFSPERYIEAINTAVSGGYDNIIIDSASHEWIGEGGCLDSNSKLSLITKNSYTAWAKTTPRHEAFLNALIYANSHLIICLRGKDEYVLEQNEKGKQAPRKVGVGAQMRDGLEYECTISLMIDQETHLTSVLKDNTLLFDGRNDMLTEEHGKSLIAWATSGKIENIKQPSQKEVFIIAYDKVKSGKYREQAIKIVDDWLTKESKDLETITEVDAAKLIEIFKNTKWG